MNIPSIIDPATCRDVDMLNGELKCVDDQKSVLQQFIKIVRKWRLSPAHVIPLFLTLLMLVG